MSYGQRRSGLLHVVRYVCPIRQEFGQRRTNHQNDDEAKHLHAHDKTHVDIARSRDDRYGVRSSRAGGQIGGARIDSPHPYEYGSECTTQHK